MLIGLQDQVGKVVVKAVVVVLNVRVISVANRDLDAVAKADVHSAKRFY